MAQHAVEQELIQITMYKVRTKFADRQDYLGSILNATMKLTDDDFNNLSDEAAEWANAAVHAKNNKEDIPDFDEVTPDGVADPDDEPEEDDDAPDEEAEGEDGGDDDDDTGGNDDSDSASSSDDDGDDDGDVEDDEADAEDDEGDEAESDEDEPDEEPEPEPKPAPKKAVKKHKHKMKVPLRESKPPKPKLHNRDPRAYKQEDVVLDKWGCMEGSKNSRAMAMFEKGASAKEVKQKLGGTYYNMLKKIVQDGHDIGKEGNIIKIVHKDDKKVGVREIAKPVKKAKK